MTDRLRTKFSIKAAARAAFPSPLWTVLRWMRLRWTLATFPQRIVNHDYAGFPLRIQIADPLAAGWYDRDWPEPPAIGLLRRHRLRDGAAVFNIGAHQGVIALILAKVVGSSGRVVAVEPMYFNASAAARNRELNEVSQLTIVHAAVGERNGRVLFSPGLNGAIDPSTSSWGKIAVEAVTIDELSRRYGAADVLFVDIEGFECRALRGATQTLALRPDCVIEAHIGCGMETFGGSLEELIGFFPSDAFTLYMALNYSSPHSDPGCWPLDRTSALAHGLFQLVALGRRKQAS